MGLGDGPEGVSSLDDICPGVPRSSARSIQRARVAAEIVQLSAPYEEIPRLDLVAISEAEGHLGEAEDYLREQVCNRSEDGGAPEDLSERTRAILRQREWLSRAG